jgi:hypothetical protein
MDAMSETECGNRVRLGGGRAYHSRLEPFVEFIRSQRRARKTWVEIAEALGAEKGCPISFQGVHQFYRRYLQNSRTPHWEQEISSKVPDEGTKPATTKPLLAVTPVPHSFRRPNPEDLTLTDPTKL